MMVGEDAHCADAVTGNAKTVAAHDAERTLVIFMTSNSNHTPPRISYWCYRGTARKLIE
jgi:hypothetical protein